jgi:folate-dependent phosphoribosylglycinamide formyltransferase PurN
LNRIFAGSLSRVEKEKQEAESRFFGNQQDADVVLLRERTLRVLEKGQSVNEPDTVELIRGLGPDIIAVMGTSLIKSAIIGIPRLGVLNIHTGLSPYYRGGRTNFWPFIYGELGRCGVTVHLLDSGIDSGDIIYHAIPEIGEADTYSSINCKMIVEGTGLMIRAIRDLVAGNIRSFRQWEGGRLFYNRDYNGLAAYRYLRTRARAVKVFLRRSSVPGGIRREGIPRALFACLDGVQGRLPGLAIPFHRAEGGCLAGAGAGQRPSRLSLSAAFFA